MNYKMLTTHRTQCYLHTIQICDLIHAILLDEDLEEKLSHNE